MKNKSRAPLFIFLLVFLIAFLVGPAFAQHNVVLSWTASATVHGSPYPNPSKCAGGVYGPISYNLYRVPWYGGSWQLLNSSPVATNCSGTTCAYTDLTVTGGLAYSYAYSAVDETNGGFSQPFTPATEVQDVVVPSSIGGQLAAPAISPIAGSYVGGQNISISVPAGAVACYTTNGTAPVASSAGTCSNGSQYAAPFLITSSLTVQAIATEAGYTNSVATSAAFTIRPPAPPTNLNMAPQ